MVIRKVIENDIPQLIKIITEYKKEQMKPLDNRQIEKLKLTIERIIKEKKTLLLVNTNLNETIIDGFINIHLIDS